MENSEESLESCTIRALLTQPKAALSAVSSHDVLPKFSVPLKSNFENRSLWLRFGLTLSLSTESPHSALQAYNECIRIDPYDPLPAMLAARLQAETLGDLDQGIRLVKEAIKRCHTLLRWANLETKENPTREQANGDADRSSTSSVNSKQLSEEVHSREGFDRLVSEEPYIEAESDHHPMPEDVAYQEVKRRYKNIRPILSQCYLMAGVMHAIIYERQPESMKEFHEHNLSSSLSYLELSLGQDAENHLLYFHKALHKAREQSHAEAIDLLRQAIKLNSHHVPSIRLLLLSLSALKKYDEALVLSESALHEFEDDPLLLYIKCNLERCLGQTKGYKMALSTIQHMLKCTKSSPGKQSINPRTSRETIPNQLPIDIKQATNLFGDERHEKRQSDLFNDELSIWLLAAEIYIKIGHIEDAEQCVDESSSHTNGLLSHEVMFVRGLIAKAKNNLIEAKSFFQSCLALTPKHARALQQIAHVYFLLGNFVTAEKFIRDSLDLDSDCYITWQYLASILIELNQHEMAIECNKKAEILEACSSIIPLNIIPRLTLE